MTEYTTRHQRVIAGQVADLSPRDTRKTASLAWTAWRMARRMRKRTGIRFEVQRSGRGYALWAPSEEIQLQPVRRA